MKRKLVAVLVLLIAVSVKFTVNAQEGKYHFYGKNEKWYVSAGGGPNILFGNQDGKAPSFGDRICGGGEISVGKWINPGLGFRAQFYFGQYRGFNYAVPQMGKFTHGDGKSIFPKGWPEKLKFTSDGSGFWQEFYTSSLSLDFTVNLTRTIIGYDVEPKLVDVIVYTGVAYLHNIKSETNHTFNGIGGRLGGRLNFNLQKKGPWGCYLEGQSMIASDKFDGYVGDTGFDLTANLLVGVQYSF